MVNVTHHQRGARDSTTPVMRSVIQLKLRLFNTNGGRLINASGEEDASSSITSGNVDSLAIAQCKIDNCKIDNHGSAGLGLASSPSGSRSLFGFNFPLSCSLS